MLTFNVILGYQGLLFWDFLLFINFFRFFFFSIRLTDPISGNALDAKRKKKGDGLTPTPYFYSPQSSSDLKYKKWRARNYEHKQRKHLSLAQKYACITGSIFVKCEL